MLGDKQKDFHSVYYYPIKSVVASQYYPILLDDLQIPTAFIIRITHFLWNRLLPSFPRLKSLYSGSIFWQNKAPPRALLKVKLFRVRIDCAMCKVAAAANIWPGIVARPSGTHLYDPSHHATENKMTEV